MEKTYEKIFDSVKKFNSSPETKDTLKIKRDLILADHSSFRIGGPADIALFPENENALIFCLDLLTQSGVEFYVIGNASNVLFDDGGVRGAVVFTEKMNDVMVEYDHIYAECGAPITKVSRAALEHSLSGLEFAYGIPGSIGGAVYMNAGAYGGQISDVVCESRCYDINEKRVRTVVGDEHGFGYRKSVYAEQDGLVILSAKMKLSLRDKKEIKAKMDENLRARREKQPLEYPSAGSTFKRHPGYYTGKIIEESGLKGFSVGGASVSEKHAGFVINRVGATSADVKAVIKAIREKIYENYGIELECEIRFIGGDPL